MLVVGIGEKKTPRPFIVACDKFIYIEIIGSKEIPKSETAPASNIVQQAEIEKIDNKFIQLLKVSIEDIADEDGWAFLAELGALLIKKKPDFDPRNYGFLKLTPLIKSLKKHFNVDERVVEKTHIKHIYVQIKK
jgi:hypothetical protein